MGLLDGLFGSGTDLDAVAKATFEANSVLIANDDDTPVALVVPPSTVVGRASSGGITALDGAALSTLLEIGSLAGYVAKGDYNANTVLVATADDDPQPLTIAASRVLGRKASGNIVALSGAELGRMADVATGFAWSANAATIDVSTARNWDATNTLGGNSTLTLANGADGDNGVIRVKQDGTGGRTLAFTIAGRTVLRDLNVADTNPLATANGITEYHYSFFTLAGTAHCRLFKVYLQ